MLFFDVPIGCVPLSPCHFPRDVLVIDEVEKVAIKIFKEVIKHCKKEMDEDVWIGMKSRYLPI